MLLAHRWWRRAVCESGVLQEGNDLKFSKGGRNADAQLDIH